MLDFSFYDLVWYWDQAKPTNDKDLRRLGRWLGVAHTVGSSMCYWELTETGKVIARTTVQHVTNSETRDKVMSDRVSTFDVNIHQRLKDDKYETKDADDPGTCILDLDNDWSNKHNPKHTVPGMYLVQGWGRRWT